MSAVERRVAARELRARAVRLAEDEAAAAAVSRRRVVASDIF
jgi:hypothetical protein